MGGLRHLTAGESHGPGLVAVLEGLPAGLELGTAYIDAHLKRRQQGHGRGGRQKIEQDRVKVLGGLRFGRTLGSPLALLIENRDFANWQDVMAPEGEPVERRRFTVPRPGHADLAGAVKYGASDLRDVLERASARETAARVAVGSAARRLLEACGVDISSHVVAIGDVRTDAPEPPRGPGGAPLPAGEANALADRSPVRCFSEAATKAMVEAIDRARERKDTLGGVIEVRATGCPVGLGSHVHWDRKLDGRIAQAFMALHAIKGVEIGDGFETARRPGSVAHDELDVPARVEGPVLAPGAPRVRRLTNRAGGLEGGITNGEDVVVRAAMKPLSTLMQPLRSIDTATGEPALAHVERSDVCAVPAAAVIGEALLALVLADAVLEKYGGDSMGELLGRLGRGPA